MSATTVSCAPTTGNHSLKSSLDGSKGHLATELIVVITVPFVQHTVSTELAEFVRLSHDLTTSGNCSANVCLVFKVGILLESLGDTCLHPLLTRGVSTRNQDKSFAEIAN